ncbi:MAG: NADH-quinone oxidoreductase subunit C [Candidatus Omnitrophica bacterium]|nr:NADH-quinone oxidoreductase subunit C [Candidatus Omnitrophota bacterium]
MENNLLLEKLREKFPDGVQEVIAVETDMCVKIFPDKIKDIAYFLKDEPGFSFDFLMCLSGVDRGEKLEVVYHLFSCENRRTLILKAEVGKESAAVESVAEVWKAANWHEREAYDLLGISFHGHPDLRRILLPDDWKGFPLRKDYEYPKEYSGIDLCP